MIGFDDFEVVPDTAGEDMPEGLSPERTVCHIALQKANNVSLLRDAGDLIIAADTLVYLDGRPLGKPADRGDAARMLEALSGRMHTVFTGVALKMGPAHLVGAEATNVYFREMSGREISDYVGTGEPMDKAGAYGSQGRGAVYVERIEGDFFNVMGFPLCRLSKMLEDFGFPM